MRKLSTRMHSSSKRTVPAVAVSPGGGVGLSACWDTSSPQEQTPPGPGPLGADPPGTRHPPDQAPPWDQAPPRDQAPTPPVDRQTPVKHNLRNFIADGNNAI